MTDAQPTAGVALKPCPFCGASRLKVDNWAGWYVRCEDCGVQQTGATKDRAVEEWNTRAPTDAGGAVGAVRQLAHWARSAFVHSDTTTKRADQQIDALADLILAALTSAPQADSYGFLFEDDDGTEWKLDDPRVTGENEYATNIRPATAKEAVQMMRSAWQVLAENKTAAPDPVAQPSEGARAKIAKLIRQEIDGQKNGESMMTRSLRLADAILASLPVQPSDLEAATWVPLDDDGLAEVRVNGKRITSMPSYDGAREVAERINAALEGTGR